jgi:hypothetical protein
MRHLCSLKFVTMMIAALALSPGMAAEAPGADEPQELGLLDWIERYDEIVLAGEGVKASGQSYRVGNMEFRFKEGIVVAVRERDGDMVGLYFKGRGSYVYNSVDPVDRQIIGKNLEKISELQLRDDFSVVDTFSEGLFFGTEPWLAGMQDLTTVGAAAALPPEAGNSFVKLSRRLPSGLHHPLVCNRLNGLDGHSFFYAELSGGKEPAAYEYDREIEPTEALVFKEKFDDNAWWLKSVSFQEPTTAEERFPQVMTMQHADFDIATADNRSGTITSDLVLQVLRPGMRFAPFRLISHRDPAGSYVVDGKNALDVVKITDGSGAELPFVHEYHSLIIDLGRSYDEGEQLKLHVETQGKMFTGFGGNAYDSYFEFDAIPWYPMPAGPRPSAFTYSIKVKTRLPFKPIASGKTVSFREEGDFCFLETVREMPSIHISIFGGKYKTYEETFDGLPIRIHSYAMQELPRSEKMARLANGIIRYYEEILGPYPFEELDILEVPELGFGIAPSGVVLLTTEAYKPRSSGMASLFSKGINARLAHEIAHHWFGHRAMVTGRRETWLSESFSEYVAGIAMGALAIKGPQNIEGFQDMLNDWRTMSNEVEQLGSVHAANQIGGNEAYWHRICLLYNRGPLLLHMLRTMVGDAQFMDMLRLHLDRADGSTVTTADFRNAVKEVRGFDMGWFFDQWVAQGGIPVVRYQYRVDKVNGGYVLSGELRQEPESYRKIVVPLLLELRGGVKAVKIVVQKKPVTTFSFELPEEPRRVLVDPNKNNLAKYKRL